MQVFNGRQVAGVWYAVYLFSECDTEHHRQALEQVARTEGHVLRMCETTEGLLLPFLLICHHLPGQAIERLMRRADLRGYAVQMTPPCAHRL